MEDLQKQEEERKSVKCQRTYPASPLDEADRDEPNVITDSNPLVDGPIPQVLSSPQAPPSPPQSSMPSGVIAIAKMNAKHRFFLASTNNSFVGHKVDKVMIDSGCSSLMLPLSPGDLLTFPARYPGSSHVWRISHSNGVSHSTVVLIIHLKNDLPMPVFLCSDLIPQQVPTTTKYLRFHLCTDDMNLLLNTPMLSSMFVVDDKLQRVSTYLNLHHPSVPRKAHALLGQLILRPNITIQYEDTMVLFAPGLFEPVKFWDSMVYLTRTLLKNNSQLLPEHFDDLEDEDHVDIDTDQEDYHPFDDWNAIDETE